MAPSRYWIMLCLFVFPGVSFASPGSCYGFFTSIYDEQIPDALDRDNRGSAVALHDLRDRYEDNRPALKYLHEKRESTRFEDEVSKGREMAKGFLPKLQNPTPNVRQQFKQSRVYCLGLLEDARKQQRDDTFVATMEALEDGSVYGEDDCPAVEPRDILANRWRALVGTRLYRLDLESNGDRLQGVLALNSNGQYEELDRLNGNASGDVVTMSNADDGRTLNLYLTRNTDCEAMLSGDMTWGNGSGNADVVFWLVD